MKRRKRLWIPEAPALHLVKNRKVGAQKNLSVQGYFTISLVHARTGLVTWESTFPNLITNLGMDLIGTVNQSFTDSQLSVALFTRCVVGTDSTEPHVNQTALGAEIGVATTNGGFGDVTGPVDNEYWFMRRTRVFDQSEANGNLTEVGFRHSSGVVVRQLIRDQSGQATTITKTDEYQLRVVYEFRIYWPQGVSNVNLNLDGTNVNAESYRGLDAWWNAGTSLAGSTLSASAAVIRRSSRPDEGANPMTGAAASINESSVSTNAYTAGSFERGFEAIWSPSIANSTLGYNCILLGRAISQRPVTIWLDENHISKTEDERFVLEHSTSWARHDPS